MAPSTDWREVIPSDETERFERYAKEIRAMQHARGDGSRGLHAKAHAGLEAEFTVLPDLPEHAKVGPFASAKTYRAYVRFSNGAGARQSDAKPDVRGVAVKLLGVPGKKVIPGLEDKQTQDFLMIASSSTPFRNADEFVSLVRSSSSPALLLPRLAVQIGLVRTAQIVPRLLKGISAPMPSLATARWHSALPIRFGAYAVKFGLAPRAEAPPPGPKSKDPDHLGKELADRLRQGAVEFDFRVQYFVSEEKTPIEDASVEWLEQEAPFLTVARLTLPQQDVASPRGRRIAEWVETLSFDPWHALEELRPLGNMMRARNPAYRESTMERRAAPEPEAALADA